MWGGNSGWKKFACVKGYSHFIASTGSCAARGQHLVSEAILFMAMSNCVKFASRVCMWGTCNSLTVVINKVKDWHHWGQGMSLQLMLPLGECFCYLKYIFDIWSILSIINWVHPREVCFVRDLFLPHPSRGYQSAKVHPFQTVSLRSCSLLGWYSNCENQTRGDYCRLAYIYSYPGGKWQWIMKPNPVGLGDYLESGSGGDSDSTAGLSEDERRR